MAHPDSRPSSMEITFRDSTSRDIPRITEIYTHAVLNDTGTFETVPPGADEMAGRRGKIVSFGLPYLVAETAAGRVVGYCYAGLYNERKAFENTAEDSVYIDPGCRGRNVGYGLLQEVIRRCDAMGYRLLVAHIGDSGNNGSIGLHAKCGYEIAGRIPNCGWKFGRWLDTVYMTRPLGAGSGAPPGGIIRNAAPEPR